MSHFKFIFMGDNVWWSVLFSVIVLACLGYGLFEFIRHRANNDATVVDWIRRGFIAILLVFMSFGPTILTNNSTQAINGTDVFFAVDITGSMGVHDAHNGNRPTQSRLTVAKEVIHSLIRQYPGASFEGISFASAAITGVPLTTDTDAINTWASNLSEEPTAASRGSSLDEALDTLIVSMQKAHKAHPSRSIVLYYISDGEETSPQPQRPFTPLRQFVNGGAIIGVGSTEGGHIPLVTPQQTSQQSQAAHQWVLNPDTRQPGISKMDNKTLEKIADEISIPYLHVDKESTIQKLSPTLSHHYLIDVTAREHTQRTSLVWIFAIILALLLLWEFIVDFWRVRRFL